MKCLEERDGGVRVLHSAPPSVVRDAVYPGCDMYQWPQDLPKSASTRAVFCRRWQLSRNNVAINVYLTEVPT